jgi:hypothetical protein
MSGCRLFSALLLVIAPTAASAQNRDAVPRPSGERVTVEDEGETLSTPAQVTDAWRSPTLTIERYDEDWSALSDPASRSGRWTEAAKYIPVELSKKVYITTGAELRERFEGYRGLGWGSAPDQGYLWSRFMPYADLHVGRVRFFAQPMMAYASGVKPAPGPVDRTGVDLLQSFADVVEDLGPDTNLRVEVGRQLFGLGSERLVGTRYGPNVPLAFDGARAILHHKSSRLILLYQRPVESGTRSFDDHSSHRRALWGGYVTQWFDAARTTGADFYYLGFRDNQASVQGASGREVRETFGSRWFGASSGWHWNAEAALQRGRLGSTRVNAWSVATEVGRSFSRSPLKPDLTLRADIASGDHDARDGRMEQFNPLFPKGKYFGDLSPLGPRNLIDVHPAATFHVSETIGVGFSAMAYWRQSRGDGIYDTPGHLLRSGNGSQSRFIGKEVETGVEWQATPELTLSASAGIFQPGSFVLETGPGRSIKMIGLESNFRF